MNSHGYATLLHKRSFKFPTGTVEASVASTDRESFAIDTECSARHDAGTITSRESLTLVIAEV